MKMGTWLSRIRAIGLLLFALSLPVHGRAQQAAHVDVLTVTGVLDTWIDGYIARGISLAEQDGAEAVIIVLNTPGGTMNAMQKITTRILNARTPVIVFVSPGGASAASAGTFVVMAANVAVMTPGATIGAAHPVALSGADIAPDERAKLTNFAVSLIRSIAQQRGRNAEWAANAVRDSVSATATEALNQQVIDLLASDLNDLLNKVDSRVVKTAAGEITLHTQRAGLANISLNLPEQFFHTLVDPNIALILLLIGLLAITLELSTPGAVIPGIVGGLCLILAFVALGNLPVNWGGAMLVVLSVILFIIDLKVNSVALTVGGLLAFMVGGLLLFTPFTLPSPVMPAVSVSPVVVLALGGVLAALFLFVLSAAVRGRKYPVVSGREALPGALGVAASDLTPNGLVRVKGEVWTARAQGESIRQGDAVQVVGVEGLCLGVVKKPQREEKKL